MPEPVPAPSLPKRYDSLIDHIGRLAFGVGVATAMRERGEYTHPTALDYLDDAIFDVTLTIAGRRTPRALRPLLRDYATRCFERGYANIAAVRNQ